MTFRYDDDVTVDVTPKGDAFCVDVNGKESVVEVVPIGDSSMAIRQSDGTVSVVHLVNIDGCWHLAVDGQHHQIEPVKTGRSRASSEDEGALEAPMPGTVLEVRVAVGDTVKQGDVLLVVEAMKMEHAITAPKDGVVAQISFEVGANVGPGDTLVAIE